MSVFTLLTWPSKMAPGEGETGGDSVEVTAEEFGEAANGLGCVLFPLADPVVQEVSALVADQIGEGSCQVASPGDVRAGEADFEQPLALALGDGHARPHDP
ncbi:hypothetical protein [Streptomyces flavidovirens]|uniref:hypothetical protein n=1 Tax=Streptomyces flavidovirens TaxID=67298 RepID=UPI0012FEA602|nr:hypothetical protein [Streptomyces flavidovirens]